MTNTNYEFPESPNDFGDNPQPDHDTPEFAITKRSRRIVTIVATVIVSGLVMRIPELDLIQDELIAIIGTVIIGMMTLYRIVNWFTHRDADDPIDAEDIRHLVEDLVGLDDDFHERETQEIPRIDASNDPPTPESR